MTTQTTSQKTNTQWYPYPDLASYFKLADGKLLQCPMYDDGSMYESEADEVDWTEVALEPTDEPIGEQLHAIEKELETKA